MRDIVFAKTRYHYPSYTDFWRLVACAGFQTCFVDEVEPRDQNKVYIFSPMNGEVPPLLPKWHGQGYRLDRATIVWWNLERPGDDNLEGTLATIAPHVDGIWVSDRTFAARSPYFTYVPVYGMPNFGVRTTERLFDVCTISYLWGRRAQLVEQLRARGVLVAPEAFGQQRQDEVVAKSRMMLNMHQYQGLDIVAPIRFAVAASYAIPIISEPFEDVKSWGYVLAQDSLAGMPETIERFLNRPERLAEEGERLHRIMCIESNFRREVERAVVHNDLAR